MSHADGALKFLGAFRQFASHLDERYHTLQAYMVPASPDLPLPPPLLDEETQKVLGEKLWQNFVSLESPDDNHKVDETQKLDVTKVAAAAGGGNYDAEEDPLNAPQVLEAVKEFRRKLEKTQSFQKKRRMELVQLKLQDMRPRVKAMMEEERRNAPLQALQQQTPPPLPPPLPAGGPPPHLDGTLPVPPMPPPPLLENSHLLPPPPLPDGSLAPPPLPQTLPDGSIPSGLPPLPVEDSGKRGRSNLPAWMTQQQQQQQQLQLQSSENDLDGQGQEPATKKQKVDDYPANFPPLSLSTHQELRDYLSSQIREYLGEEEASLIEFLHTHILGGKTTTELLAELQVVLEEDSAAFLQGLWKKIEELQMR